MRSSFEFPIVLGLYGFATAVAFLLAPDWTARQTWAVVLTGVVVIWYTWETKRLRETSARQLEVQIRPFVFLRPANGGEFVVENVGAGAALNVRVREVVVDSDHDVRIRFPDIVPVLRRGEIVPLRAETFREGRRAGDFFTAHIDPRYANRPLSLTIEYQNLELKSYMVVQKTELAAMKIVGFGIPGAV